MTFLDQGFGQGNHLGQMVGGLGLHAGRQGIQRPHVLAVPGRKLRRQFFHVPTRLLDRRDNFVIDIGNITGVDHLGILGLQQAKQRIEHHHWPGVAYMRQVIDGRSAHIHSYPVRLQGNKILFLTTEGVVDP